MTVPGRRWPARRRSLRTQHLLCPPGGKMHTDSRLSKFSNFSRIALTVLLSAPVILAGTKASGQVDRAVLEGMVTDPSGSVIVGATLKVVAVDTGLTQEQSTNSKGYYRFPGLAVGQYIGNGHGKRIQNQGGGRRRPSRRSDTHSGRCSLGSEPLTRKIEVKATLDAHGPHFRRGSDGH